MVTEDQHSERNHRAWPRIPLGGREMGSAMVEFGLILPAFLLLAFGIIDFGRAVWAYNTLSYATREGARYASIHGSESGSPVSANDVSVRVKDRAVGMAGDEVMVTTVWDPNNNPGSAVRVQAQYYFKAITPFYMGDPILLQSRSRMVVTW